MCFIFYLIVISGPLSLNNDITLFLLVGSSSKFLFSFLRKKNFSFFFFINLSKFTLSFYLKPVQYWKISRNLKRKEIKTVFFFLPNNQNSTIPVLEFDTSGIFSNLSVLIPFGDTFGQK